MQYKNLQLLLQNNYFFQIFKDLKVINVYSVNTFFLDKKTRGKL
jgi:hypothetical protein